MGKHIFEEGPRKGHAAGDSSVEQQASQLASDIKYKARQKMKQTAGSDRSPAQVQALYRQFLNASPAPGAVKSIVKKKLFGEQVDRGVEFVSETIKASKSSIFDKIFVEGGGQKEEVIEEDADQKFIVRVTDKATGNTSYRKADRAKIAQLRANPNISSVEITGRKKADDAYNDEKSGGKKAKKDYDGDGKIESGTAEYMGSRDKAIKKAMAKEEIIYEKEDNNGKKIDVMKGKNTVKVNPSIGESIRAELDALKFEKIEEQEDAMKKEQEERKKEQLAQQQEKKDKMMRMRILRHKMMAVRGGTEVNASHQPEGDVISDECEKCGGDHDTKDHGKKEDEDPRSMKTKINLARNKLRAMGLKMSYDMKGESIDEVMSPKEKGESERARSSSTLDMDRRTKSAYHAARGAMIAVKQLKRDAAELKNESIDEKYLSVDDQMRISREANAKRKPYQPGDRQKQRAAQLKQMAKNAPKDTRTDAQKMSDATGPRPGSRYRGD